MNISEIHIEDFGAWHDLRLEQLSTGATVFYGPNEAGKTTVLNLVRSVLYGFSQGRCQKYLPPAQGTEAGGALRVSGINGDFALRRTANRNYEGGTGSLRITSSQGESHGAEFLTTLLAGVDETIFNNVFAVGLTQIQALSTLSDTEAAAQLYGLATGVDRVSLHEVMRTLADHREELFPLDRNNEGGIQRLAQQRDRMQKELKALQRDASHWANQRQEFRELTRLVQQKERAKASLQSAANWPELSAKVRKQWAQCRQMNDRLARIGPLADIPQQVASRIRGLNKQIAEQRAEWEKLRDERRRIKAHANKSKGSDTLYRHAAEIEALDRQRPRILALEDEVERGKKQGDELDFEIRAEIEQLGLQAGTSTHRMPNISDQVIEALREPARATRELRERVDAAQKIAEQAKEAARVLKGKLETAALRFGGEDIDSALKRTRDLVQRLDRRIELDEDSDGIVRRMEHMQEETKYWRGRTVMPWAGILTICGVFSAGVALLLGGLLNEWFHLAESARLPMMMIGGSFALVSLVIKGAFESSALERADYCEQQMDALFQQQTKRQEETSEIDRILPTGNDALTQRMLNAQKEYSELQQFVPLQNRYQELQHEVEAAEHQATLAVRELKESRRGWKASLRAVGLPDTLTPSQIGEMTGRVHDLTRLRQQAEQTKRLMHDRQQELATIRERITQLQTIAEISETPEGLGPQLDRLLLELKKHARSGRKRDGYRQKWEELQKKQQRVASAAEQAMSARRQLLVGHGLAGKRDFQSTMAQSNKASQMRKQRNALLEKIAEAVGDEFTVPKLRKLLDRRSNRLLQFLDEVDNNREAIGADLSQLHQRAGELKQKLEAHAQDQRAEKKQLAIHVLDERIRKAERHWQLTALVSAALDSVKQNYETKRQPVALAEASRFLERLTVGRYTRIWTPMGKSSLCVDGLGNTLPVEKLSRGTRELVFLALRLALVGSYKRRGASMPIVLDDVFVNFDDQRAAAVATVLADLAKSGQQLLIFTCHKRIRKLFSELDADVRDLPIRSGLSQSVSGVHSEPIQVKQPAEAPLPTEAKDFEPAQPTTGEPVVTSPAPEISSWAETLASLAAAEMAAETPKIEQEAPLQIGDVTDPIVVEDPARDMADDDLGQFKPAWRDEWLEPLPDLDAPTSSSDDDWGDIAWNG